MTTVIDDIDYGPLACLIGTWRGDDGIDVAPESDGTEHNPYHEQILFEACGDVTNAEEQKLAVVRYHQVVSRKSNNKVFHNESGYLTWDATDGSITQSFSIPRGVAVVASGQGNLLDGGCSFEVAASGDDISQSDFMRAKARTESFSHKVEVVGDEMNYSETTVLEIYGQSFKHTDENRLTRKGD